jgi:hypothetical protein
MLRDGSTPITRRLGAERSLVQIESPRLLLISYAAFAEGLVTRRQVFWTRDEALEAARLRGWAAAT